METTALTSSLDHLNPPIEAYLFFPKGNRNKNKQNGL